MVACVAETFFFSPVNALQKLSLSSMSCRFKTVNECIKKETNKQTNEAFERLMVHQRSPTYFPLEGFFIQNLFLSDVTKELRVKKFIVHVP